MKSFADLVNLFSQQFASSRGLEKRTADLYKIIQGPTESLRDYLGRFNKEKISIHNCDRITTVEAYRCRYPNRYLWNSRQPPNDAKDEKND